MSRCPRTRGGLTKTQQLRQAKTSATIKQYEERQETLARQQGDQFKIRKKIVKPEPKKVDFSKPGMTKTMMARMKQAEKMKEDYERKQAKLQAEKFPRRTPAPIGGDSRLGRERTPCRGTKPIPMPPAATSLLRPPQIRREMVPGTSRIPSARKDMSKLPRVTKQAVPVKTNELAKLMNAEVIQAEPVGDGPISNIVIPPGMVSDERTTVISIQQPDANTSTASQVANRSVKIISDALDEQDATEKAAMNSKLIGLQQARRDFVIAVANVGGNAVNIEDEIIPSDLEGYSLGSPLRELPIAPEVPEPKHYFRVPDIEDDYLQIQYGRDHPDILAAREFMKKAKVDMEEREAQRRLEDEFERIAREPLEGQLDIDVPFEEELYQARDISWEDDECGMPMPRPSRVKTYASPVPQRQEAFQYGSFDPEDLEKFFDIDRNPPCPQCGPPPGRENLNPDLWELIDPWYQPPPPPDIPDLIDFD